MSLLLGPRKFITVLVDENNYEANKFRVMKTGAIMKEETTGI
jgi:hypothetical protein